MKEDQEIHKATIELFITINGKKASLLKDKPPAELSREEKAVWYHFYKMLTLPDYPEEVAEIEEFTEKRKRTKRSGYATDTFGGYYLT